MKSEIALLQTNDASGSSTIAFASSARYEQSCVRIWRRRRTVAPVDQEEPTPKDTAKTADKPEERASGGGIQVSLSTVIVLASVMIATFAVAVMVVLSTAGSSKVGPSYHRSQLCD